MNDIVLENDALRLRFDRETGRLTELTALQTKWRLLDRPALGLSFRLLIPLPGQRKIAVDGERQPAPAITVTQMAGPYVGLEWRRLRAWRAS